MALLAISILSLLLLLTVGLMLARVPDPHHRFSLELWDRLSEDEDSGSQFEMRAAD